MTRKGAKTAVLHIGTHKTGTTSLQTMIARNQQRFCDQGLWYPAAGRGSGEGHHNLAWELNGDDRYDPASGSLADLVVELEQVQARAVLLSSEDFEYLYRRPEQLVRLRESLEGLGYGVRVVVVLREPAEYVESLYTELGKHGLVQSLDGFVARALAEGGVTFRGWDFRLNYEQLVSGFASVFGDRAVHVLPYDRSDAVGPVLAACGRLLHRRLSPIVDWERFNARPHARNAVPADPSSVADSPSPDGTTLSGTSLTTAEREAIDAAFSGSLSRLVERPVRHARLAWLRRPASKARPRT